MPQTPRKTPTGSGPGRGTPRTRATSRPGDRTQRSRSQEVPAASSSATSGTRRRVPEPASMTWRLAVLVIVLAGIALLLANTLRVYFAQSHDLALVKTQIAQEKERIADLEDKLKRWDDPDYVRSVARTRLGWVMPGETGYRVIGADGKPLEGVQLTTAQEPEKLWWEKMWGSVTAADQLGQEETKTPATPAPSDRVIGASPSPSSTP